MIPILYPSNTSKSDFARNGLGFLENVKSCTVTEALSGEYELKAELISRSDAALPCAPGMFVKARANPQDAPQLFEIYDTKVTEKKIALSAQHIRYIPFNNVISEAISPQTPKNPAQWWAYISDYFAVPCLWDFTSNITNTGIITAGNDRPIRLGDFLRGKKGSMLDTFGGEFKFDNFTINLLSRRGSDTGICLRYGSGLGSFTQQSSSTTMYSHLLPYAYVKTQDSQTGQQYADMAVYSSLIDLENTSQTYKRVLSYDFSDNFSDDTILLQGGTVPLNYSDMQQKLMSLAWEYTAKNESALTNISANITVTADTALESLSDISLGDTVLVYFEPLNITVRAKIVKTQYDVLRERYVKIELGTVRKTIADLFSGKNIGGA